MDPVKTGTLIRTLRTRLGLTQRELAERLTVEQPHHLQMGTGGFT